MQLAARKPSRMRQVAYITDLSGVVTLFGGKSVRIWECLLIHNGDLAKDCVMRIQDAADTGYPDPRMVVKSPTGSASNYITLTWSWDGRLFPNGARLSPEGTWSPGFGGGVVEHVFICNYEEVGL